jgi:prepilin-type processing-associated H-X9-DG protein
MMHCPDDTIQRDDCAIDRYGTGIIAPLSYSWTYYDGNDASTTGFGICPYSVSTPSTLAAKVGAPANTVVLYELYMTTSYVRWCAYYRANNVELADARRLVSWPQFNTYNWCGTLDGKIAIGTHLGLTNYGFADGHVKTLRRETLMGLLGPGVWDGKAPNLVHWDSQYK